MKKLFVILLVALLLVSFTSCNQDKIDDLEKKVAEKEAENEATIQNYEDFTATYNAAMKIALVSYTLAYDSSSKSYNETLSAENVTGEKIISAWYYINGGDYISDVTKSTEEGGISGTIKTSETGASIKNVIVKFTYKTSSSSETTNNGEISMNVETTSSTSEDGKTRTTTAKSVSLQGVSYKDISFTQDEKGTFTAATVDGKDVNLNLLNSQIVTTTGK